jgi:hypothetical protein
MLRRNFFIQFEFMNLDLNGCSNNYSRTLRLKKRQSPLSLVIWFPQKQHTYNEKKSQKLQLIYWNSRN